MESYLTFKDRIDNFEKPQLSFGDKGFVLNQRVWDKFDENNSFKRFYGDTTVFVPDDNVKERICQITDTLYREAGECFAQRLNIENAHITLHDLSNGCDLDEISTDMFHNEVTLLKFVESGKIPRCAINFETNYVVNMFGTSIALALRPKSKEDYDRMMSLYSIVDCARVLPYYITPHILLAYYNVNGFDKDNEKKLIDIVNRLNQMDRFDVSVSTDALYYEKFTDMNNYVKVFTIT